MGRPTIHAGCQVEGCERPHKSQGYCASHYKQFRRGLPIKPLNPHTYDHAETCEVSGCDAPHFAKGLCQTHYKRKMRHGSVDAVNKPWDLTK